MSNKKRICIPGFTYHTFSRCIDKSSMMKPDEMKDLMITVLNLALEKYNFELISYVIMDNHFHFFIKTVKGGESISTIMQFIKSQYALRYNRKMNRSGPFWNERFGDTIVEESNDPGLVFNYINIYILNNPVRAKYVKKARDYKYSAIKFYLDKNFEPALKLTHHKYFLDTGESFKARVQKFTEFEEIYHKRISAVTI